MLEAGDALVEAAVREKGGAVEEDVKGYESDVDWRRMSSFLGEGGNVLKGKNAPFRVGGNHFGVDDAVGGWVD